MNISQQKAKELVETYDQILEQQIVERGSSLPCRSEELWMQVEELLKNGNAQEIHCLGLDPLRVMEESLKAEAAAVPATSCGRRVRVKGGLQGLATAFEVLEQASLNLFLGPWREEYRVIKVSFERSKMIKFGMNVLCRTYTFLPLALSFGPYLRCTLARSPITSHQCCRGNRLKNCLGCWDTVCVGLSSFISSHLESILVLWMTSSACLVPSS